MSPRSANLPAKLRRDLPQASRRLRKKALAEFDVCSAVANLAEKNMPNRDIKHLLQLLDEAYSRAAWHGPNLRSSMRGVTARQAAQRPARGRHNIWEVVVHAAYWKYVVRRRLAGEKRGSFALPGSNWFVRPVDGSEKAWKADIGLLEAEHRKLRECIAALPPNELDRSARGSRSSPRRLIAGNAFHDVYHAGQIQLIKKLVGRKKTR